MAAPPIHNGSPSAPAAQPALVGCEDEPIRIPGSVQRHGFLLLLDATGNRIVAASENATEFLELPLKLLIGASIDAVLDREILATLRALSPSSDASGLMTYLGSFLLHTELYNVVTHKIGEERALEFEQLDRLVSPELMNAVITNFVGKLSKLGNEQELLEAITRQVKDLTGFNRVLLYRFDEVGHGQVLAEENDGALPACLDLRFPASDIPPQARELYILNTVRIIPDAHYVPSPLQGAVGRSMANLDLSMSLLRSVSPIHLEYMRNMGTMSSMSISIVCEGRLWGLISGHHATPLLVPYLIRSACDLLTKMVSTQLTAFKTTANLRQMVHFQAVQRNMLTQMAAENNYLTAIIARMDDLIQVTNAEGAALIVDGQCWLTGQSPGEDSVLRLANWMDAQPDLKLFETPRLPEEIGWANEISSTASGLLAISISDVRQSYLMWFRPELVRTVKWAGEPGKISDEENRLRPRVSFNTWKELVRGQSEQWTEMEIESAREFRAAVMTISLKRAEESAELNEARFEQLTHTLPNLIWTADDDGQLTYVNQKWRDEGLGDQGCWYEQARLADGDRQWCGELWKASVAEDMPFEAEMRFRRLHDDAERWNLVRAIPFLRVNRTRAGWVGTCTDLTDRRERELALGMTEKLALTGRMTSVIAHEINNPLEAITNLLYLLKIEVPHGGPAMNYIGMAESELQRISGITKQTLRWSREVVQKADHGTAGALFEDVKLIYAGKIRNRGLTVIMAGGDDTPVFGVISQLQQVVANLVSNAIDAVPVGGRIWLSAASKGEIFEIIVRDEGPGMSPEMLRQIFKPFYSTKGDLGNGLGLYISQEIVERHAGRLIVETVIGEGTTIRVSLPSHPTTRTSASLPGPAALRD